LAALDIDAIGMPVSLSETQGGDEGQEVVASLFPFDVDEGIRRLE
jgi:hypothetical protein